MNEANDQETLRLKQAMEEATAADRPIAGDPETASLREAWLAFAHLAATADESLPALPETMTSIAPQKPRRLQWAGLIAATAAAVLLAVTCGWWFGRDGKQQNRNASNGEPLLARKAAPAQAEPQAVKQDLPKTAVAQAEKTTSKIAKSAAVTALAWDDPLDTQITSVSQEIGDVEENWQHRVNDVDLVQYRIDEVSASLENDAL